MGCITSWHCHVYYKTTINYLLPNSSQLVVKRLDDVIRGREASWRHAASSITADLSVYNAKSDPDLHQPNKKDISYEPERNDNHQHWQTTCTNNRLLKVFSLFFKFIIIIWHWVDEEAFVLHNVMPVGNSDVNSRAISSSSHLERSTFRYNVCETSTSYLYYVRKLHKPWNVCSVRFYDDYTLNDTVYARSVV